MRVGLLSLALFFAFGVPSVQAQVPGQMETTQSAVVVLKAQVLRVIGTETKSIPGTENTGLYQTLSARLLSGADTGKTITVENDYLALEPDDTFYLIHTTNTAEGIDAYTVLEPDRLPALGIMFGLFILVVILIGGWTGLRGLLALAASILLVFYALLPGIAAGYDPVVVASLVAGLIVIFGSYLTHGVNRTTSAAVLGLVATVVVTAFIAKFAISFTYLSGFSEESTVALNFASEGSIDFVGLLLGAMLIGALGILYDAAIGQAIAVEELLRAAPAAPRRYIFTRAMRMGREHIGALVNTLAIAYVGVALPLLLLFQSYGAESFLQTINHEMFATEIVRAIVGSLGIVLAVPISTLAALILLTHSSKKSVI